MGLRRRYGRASRRVGGVVSDKPDNVLSLVEALRARRETWTTSREPERIVVILEETLTVGFRCPRSSESEGWGFDIDQAEALGVTLIQAAYRARLMREAKR
jgi:hypothetical protein